MALGHPAGREIQEGGMGEHMDLRVLWEFGAGGGGVCL